MEAPLGLSFGPEVSFFSSIVKSPICKSPNVALGRLPMTFQSDTFLSPQPSYSASTEANAHPS
jgi:hypothetical protein